MDLFVKRPARVALKGFKSSNLKSCRGRRRSVTQQPCVSCLIWRNSQTHGRLTWRQSVPADHLMGFVMWFHVFKDSPETFWGGCRGTSACLIIHSRLRGALVSWTSRSSSIQPWIAEPLGSRGPGGGAGFSIDLFKNERWPDLTL